MGAVAVAQMVWVFAFGTKANPIGLLLGIGYEKVSMNTASRAVANALASSTSSIASLGAWSFSLSIFTH